jgi:hypothetical protein
VPLLFKTLGGETGWGMYLHVATTTPAGSRWAGMVRLRSGSDTSSPSSTQLARTWVWPVGTSVGSDTKHGDGHMNHHHMNTIGELRPN